MEEVIWIEVLSRHREVAARYRCVGPEVHVGHGYANDVFIDDARAARDHLRIYRDETGALVAEDRSGGAPMLTRIDGDHPIRVGGTSIRVRDASYLLAPEPVPAPTRWTIDIALALAVIVIEVLSVWLQETSETRLIRYVQPPLIAAAAVLVWIGGWSLMTRVFSGRARFEVHVRVALLGLLAYEIVTPILSTLAYSLSVAALASYGYVVGALVLGVICLFHLREINPSHLPAKTATVTALTVAVIAFVTLIQIDGSANSDPQSQFRRMLPPILRLAPAKTDTVFLSDAQKLQAELDEDRTKEPAAGGPPSGPGDNGEGSE